jgi:hypothetical protein
MFNSFVYFKKLGRFFGKKIDSIIKSSLSCFAYFQRDYKLLTFHSRLNLLCFNKFLTKQEIKGKKL